MKKISKMVAIPSLVLLISACGGSLPNCDSKEVRALLKQISSENGLSLSKISAISTLSREKKECSCTALATFLGIGQVPIEYTINLADDEKEFMVTMMAR